VLAAIWIGIGNWIGTRNISARRIAARRIAARRTTAATTVDLTATGPLVSAVQSIDMANLTLVDVDWIVAPAVHLEVYSS
jgi:hypothetical protein